MKVQELGEAELKQIADETMAALAEKFGRHRLAAFLSSDADVARELAKQTFLAVRRYLVNHS